MHGGSSTVYYFSASIIGKRRVDNDLGRNVDLSCHAIGQLAQVGVKTFYITPASPWENGYNESFNGSLRDEPLNGEIFYTLTEAPVLIEAWRRHYNTVRPHSSLGYRPPAPKAALSPVPSSGSATLHLGPTLAMEVIMH